MKSPILLFILSFLVINLFGQTEIDKKNLAGAHVSFGKGHFGYRDDMLGGGGFENGYYYALGIDYSRKLSEYFDLCTGMEYTYSNVMYSVYYSPRSNESLKLITIPAQIKFHLGKHFYLNGGMFVNVSAKYSSGGMVTSRAGEWVHTNNVNMLLGCGLGAGFEHEFDSGVVLSFNPYVRWNGIGGVESFYKAQQELYKFSPQGGVSFGMGKKF